MSCSIIGVYVVLCLAQTQRCAQIDIGLSELTFLYCLLIVFAGHSGE